MLLVWYRVDLTIYRLLYLGQLRRIRPRCCCKRRSTAPLTSNNLLIAFILLKSPCAQLTSCKYSFQGCIYHVAAHIDSLADRCLSWLEVLMPMLIIGRSCAKLLIAVRLLLHNYDVCVGIIFRSFAPLKQQEKSKIWPSIITIPSQKMTEVSLSTSQVPEWARTRLRTLTTAVVVKWNDSVALVVCPFPSCWEIHGHGSERAGEGHPTSRLSHCNKLQQDYQLIWLFESDSIA